MFKRDTQVVSYRWAVLSAQEISCCGRLEFGANGRFRTPETGSATSKVDFEGDAISDAGTKRKRNQTADLHQPFRTGHYLANFARLCGIHSFSHDAWPYRLRLLLPGKLSYGTLKC